MVVNQLFVFVSALPTLSTPLLPLHYSIQLHKILSYLSLINVPPFIFFHPFRAHKVWLLHLCDNHFASFNPLLSFLLVHPIQSNPN